MCVPNHNALLSYAGLKIPAPSPYFSLNPAASQLSALEFHRSQFCDYRQLLGIRQYQALHASGLGPYAAAYLDPYTQYLYKGDPRARFVQEEPKPAHSYIGLIAMAILSSKDKKLVLSDIYQWILDNYPYFRTRGPGWRNSIRHNLSLNDCFIKSGRSANGKGHYWAVHPANVDDFTRGDFRRRRAQRKVRKHMGLSVPDDDDDSPSPSPNPLSWAHGGGQDSAKDLGEDCDNNNAVSADGGELDDGGRSGVGVGVGAGGAASASGAGGHEVVVQNRGGGEGFVPLPGRGGSGVAHVSKKRLFDVESLLAPDYPVVVVPKVRLLESAAPSLTAHQGHSDLDSVTSDQRQGCLSDDSDVDIEGEDAEESCTADSDKDRQMTESDHQSHVQTSDRNQEEEVELSGAEDAEIQIEDPASEVSEERQSRQNHASTCTSTSTSTTPLPSSSSSSSSCPVTTETSTSALDLSSSSSPSSSSTMTSMTVMPAAAPGSAQALLLPRSLDASQRARWMGLGLGLGLGGVGMGGPSADLGLRRYSAFHAATGAGPGGNPGLRGSLASSVAPFLHPVFAAARYPSLVPLGASSSPSSSSSCSSSSSSITAATTAIAAAAAAAAAATPGAGRSDPSLGRGRSDDASHSVSAERV